MREEVSRGFYYPFQRGESCNTVCREGSGEVLGFLTDGQATFAEVSGSLCALIW